MKTLMKLAVVDTLYRFAAGLVTAETGFLA